MSSARVVVFLLLAALLSVATCAPQPLDSATHSGAKPKQAPTLKTAVRKRRSSFKLRRKRRKSGLGGDDDDEQGEETPNPIEERVDAAIDDAEDRLSCFPPHATLERADGSRVRMDELSIGDEVRVAPGSGRSSFLPVFMFTHKDASAAAAFVTLETVSGAAITSTDGHYIYADGELVRARDVTVGAVLTLASGEKEAVVRVQRRLGTGVYNPQTLSGDIVVDGVLASTYTTAVEPKLAHAVLAPLRLLQSFGVTVSAFEAGGGFFAKFVPRGQTIVS